MSNPTLLRSDTLYFHSHINQSREHMGASHQRFIWIVSSVALAVATVCFATSDNVLAGPIAATR